MPWGWGGRGWRNWYYATGMPGWVRASYGLPAWGAGWRFSYSGFWPGWGRGNPYPFCRWFPWLPRWWWTGMYGPVQWTSQGPQLVSQSTTQTFPQQPQPVSQPTTQTAQTQQFPVQVQPQLPFSQQLTKEQEIQYLEQELNALEQERKSLEQEIQSIKERLNSLKTQK